MDWESKFSSIVRETESNLAKVKERLGSARASSNAALSFNGGPTTMLSGQRQLLDQDNYAMSAAHSSPMFDWPGSSTDGFQLKSNYVNNSASFPLVADGSSGLSLERSPGVIAVLQDRLDTQAKTIDNLARTVRGLEEERDVYYKQMKNLREEMTMLTSRVCEKGVDLQTERKMDQWKRDVASEMQQLQHQVQYYRGNREEDDSLAVPASFSQEAQNLRRFTQEECEIFRRELDTVKHRLAKVETNVANISSDYKDSNHRQDRLNQNVRELMDCQHSASKDFNKSVRERDQDKTEITQLKSSYQSLRGKLDHLETTLTQESHAHRNADTSLPVARYDLAPRTSSADDFLSQTTSDLDLSDTDGDGITSDLEDLPSPVGISRLLSADEDVEPGLTDLNLTTDLNLSDDNLSSIGDSLDIDDLK